MNWLFVVSDDPSWWLIFSFSLRCFIVSSFSAGKLMSMKSLCCLHFKAFLQIIDTSVLSDVFSTTIRFEFKLNVQAFFFRVSLGQHIVWTLLPPMWQLVCDYKEAGSFSPSSRNKVEEDKLSYVFLFMGFLPLAVSPLGILAMFVIIIIIITYNY